MMPSSCSKRNGCMYLQILLLHACFRVLALLKNSAEDMKRVAPYLAASIITGFVGGTFPPAIEVYA